MPWNQNGGSGGMKFRWALGFALMIASPAYATDWSQAVEVDVVTTEYKFLPKSFVFQKGTPYRLHLVNKGKEMHEFTAPEFFKTLGTRDTAALNEDKVEIELAPGATKDLYFVPLQTGKFPLRCSDHDWAGMIGRITVR